MATPRWLGPLAVYVALPLFAQQATPPQTTSGQSIAPAPIPSAKLVPRSPEERERTFQVEHHIILNVLVNDASGKPVEGLTRGDFSLLDNQQPQKIASFRAEKGSTAIAPVHVMLVLDVVNNSSKQLANQRSGIEKFLTQNHGRLTYPVSFVLLSDSRVTVTPSSRDGNALIAELKNLPIHPHVLTDAPEAAIDPRFQPSGASTIISPTPGANDQNRRFQLSVETLLGLAAKQEQVSGRVTLIWVGSGWPPLLGSGFRPDTPAVQKSFFAYIVNLSTAMREAQMTVDAIDTRSGYDKPFLQGVPEVDQAHATNLALPVLAYQSGGQVLEKGKDLADQIAACIADADSYYVLSFDSAPDAKPDEYHSLEVKVNRPGLTSRTIKAYYAEP